MLRHVDARDRALAHAYARSTVSGDQTAEEFEEVRVVTDHQHAFAVGVLIKQLLKSDEVSIGCERSAYLDFRLVTHLRAHKLSGLQGAFERTGDDDVDLHTERAEHPGDQDALVLAVFDQGAFGVQRRIVARDSGIGMTHQVEIHSDGFSAEVLPNSLDDDFNTVLTIICWRKHWTC